MSLFSPITYHLSTSLLPTVSTQLDTLLQLNGATRAEGVDDPKLTHVIAESLKFEGWEHVVRRAPGESEEGQDGNGTGGGEEGEVGKDVHGRCVEIVTPKWVERSAVLGRLQPEEFFSADPAKLFSGICACSTDLPSTDLEVLSAGITALGGQWRSSLTKEVTHLFALSPDSPKYSTAIHYKPETGIKVLLPHWFDDVVRLGMRGLGEEVYEWPEPRLLKGPEGLDAPQAKDKDKGKGKEKENVPAQDVQAEKERVKRNMYATAHMFTQPMNRSSPPSQKDINLVTSGMTPSTSKHPPPASGSSNGNTSILSALGFNADGSAGVQHQVWAGRKVLLSRTLQLHRGRHQAVRVNIERAGGVVLRYEGDDEEQEVLEANQGQPDTQLRLNERLSKKEKLRRKREAELVDECDVLVTRWRYGRAYVQAVRQAKTIGTLAWLFHVQSTGIFAHPFDQLLHYPIPKRPIEGFEGHVVTVTNYTGEAREYLKKLIMAMGATFTPSMSGQNTALVAAYIQGTKATKALSWSIPVVNHTWLEDCFIQWRNLTPANIKYIHFPPGVDFSALLGERGVHTGGEVVQGGGGGGIGNVNVNGFEHDVRMGTIVPGGPSREAVMGRIEGEAEELAEMGDDLSDYKDEVDDQDQGEEPPHGTEASMKEVAGLVDVTIAETERMERMDLDLDVDMGVPQFEPQDDGLMDFDDQPREREQHDVHMEEEDEEEVHTKSPAKPKSSKPKTTPAKPASSRTPVLAQAKPISSRMPAKPTSTPAKVNGKTPTSNANASATTSKAATSNAKSKAKAKAKAISMSDVSSAEDEEGDEQPAPPEEPEVIELDDSSDEEERAKVGAKQQAKAKQKMKPKMKPVVEMVVRTTPKDKGKEKEKDAGSSAVAAAASGSKPKPKPRLRKKDPTPTPSEDEDAEEVDSPSPPVRSAKQAKVTPKSKVDGKPSSSRQKRGRVALSSDDEEDVAAAAAPSRGRVGGRHRDAAEESSEEEVEPPPPKQAKEGPQAKKRPPRPPPPPPADDEEGEMTPPPSPPRKKPKKSEEREPKAKSKPKPKAKPIRRVAVEDADEGEDSIAVVPVKKASPVKPVSAVTATPTPSAAPSAGRGGLMNRSKGDARTRVVKKKSKAKEATPEPAEEEEEEVESEDEEEEEQEEGRPKARGRKAKNVGKKAYKEVESDQGEEEDVVVVKKKAGKKRQEEESAEEQDEEEPQPPKRKATTAKSTSKSSAKSGREEEPQQAKKGRSKPLRVYSDAEEEDEEEEELPPIADSDDSEELPAAPLLKSKAEQRAEASKKAKEKEKEKVSTSTSKPAPSTKAKGKGKRPPTPTDTEPEEEEEEEPTRKAKATASTSANAGTNTPKRTLSVLLPSLELSPEKAKAVKNAMQEINAKVKEGEKVKVNGKEKAKGKGKQVASEDEAEVEEVEKPEPPKPKKGRPTKKDKEEVSTSAPPPKSKAQPKPKPVTTSRRHPSSVESEDEEEEEEVNAIVSSGAARPIARTESIKAVAGQAPAAPSAATPSKSARAKAAVNGHAGNAVASSSKVATNSVTASASVKPKPKAKSRRDQETPMDVDQSAVGSVADDASVSVAPPRRSAAAKATQRLHDTVMPDLLQYEAQRKKAGKGASSSRAFAMDGDDGEVERRKKRGSHEAEDGEAEKPKKKRRVSDADSADELEIISKPSTAKGKGKQKVVDPDAMDVDGDGKRLPGEGVVIMTTQVSLKDDVVKALTKLGVKITTRPNECTHLVASNLVRTEKFLCALASRAPWIVTEKWATQCAEARKILPEKDFLLKDKAGESKYGVVLTESLRRSKALAGKLLAGHTFYVTPKVPVDAKLLKNVVTACGGQLLTQTPTVRIINAAPTTRHVISCKEDINIWRPLASQGIKIYTQELVLTGALAQDVQWDREEFLVPQ